MNDIQYVMITGGRGYIGSNLRSYLRVKYTVSSQIVDKKIGTYTQNITDIYNNDAIVHLSAISGIQECEKNKYQAYIDNILSTITIMNAAYKYNKPLVYASSQAAKFPENGMYAMSKWIGEQHAKYLNSKGANIKILRFANVYGGEFWQCKTSVVAKFRTATEKGKLFIVNGTGEQKRDFIHIKDLCEAIYLALTCERLCYSPIDIGTGEMFSIKEVAGMISDNFRYNPYSSNVGVNENVANIILAEKLLGFKSKITISKESIYM